MVSPPVGSAAGAWPDRYLPFSWDEELISEIDFSSCGEFGECHIFRLALADLEPGVEKLLIACQHESETSGPNSEYDIQLATVAVQLQRQNFTIATLFEPSAPGRAAVGLLTYLTSYDGISPQERSLIDEFRERGWFVAAVEPHALLRIGKHSFIGIEGAGGSGKGLGIAAPLAHELDKRLADSAYFAEGVRDYLSSTRPGLQQGADVVIGASAGGIALPTVIARIGKPDAAVIIGGGANLAAISMGFHHQRPFLSKYVVDTSRRANAENAVMVSTTATGEHVFYKSVGLDRRERGLLAQHVLPLSRLDPYHTAESLHGVPTLMLQASLDRIVAASSGKLLYEALGRPERWSYPLGHIGLFAVLPAQADRIADWVEAKVGK
ncbi:MAG: hypothetical protein ACR2RV_24900 [Verrucomicrobiales bacterium]